MLLCISLEIGSPMKGKHRLGSSPRLECLHSLQDWDLGSNSLLALTGKFCQTPWNWVRGICFYLHNCHPPEAQSYHPGVKSSCCATHYGNKQLRFVSSTERWTLKQKDTTLLLAFTAEHNQPQHSHHPDSSADPHDQHHLLSGHLDTSEEAAWLSLVSQNSATGLRKAGSEINSGPHSSIYNHCLLLLVSSFHFSNAQYQIKLIERGVLLGST